MPFNYSSYKRRKGLSRGRLKGKWLLVERAQGYVDNNMRKSQGYQGQDFTGGAVDKYAGKFASNGNSYKGKGFQEFDFTGGAVSNSKKN